jgi:3-phenylpropionate/trans-cinnamate dioxygenase ferredoxin reductase subunit
MRRAIIVGAGQAGAQGAASLRLAGFDGAILMIGAEEAPPYQRPPLSKAFLKGDLTEDRLYLRPDAFYEKERVEVRLGERVTAIDVKTAEVETDRGRRHAYDVLMLATGAPPRRLNAPGAGLAGLYYLRTLADSKALQPVLASSARIAIVGAGYIGLEVAAVMRQSGHEVTVIEAADRPLARVASSALSQFFEGAHRAAGVKFRFSASVCGFSGADGALCAVDLAGGERIPCDAALIGIGAAPDTALAIAAGLAVDNGITVDDRTRASAAGVFAAGDCANFPSARYGRRLRLESVPNAIEQAKAAAANMAGVDTVYDPLPWFWSDQYDIKLQTVGLGDGADAIVTRGAPGDRKFSLWHMKQGRVLAVDAVNDPAAFAMGRKLILADASVSVAALADPATDLRTLG